MKRYRFVIILCFMLLLVLSCAHRAPRKACPPHPVRHKQSLALMGYTIQAGAFKNVDNAVRLTEKLKSVHGLDATYFLASDNFFKVRFGNFTTKEIARQRALSLKEINVIEDFYIVRPEDYSVARQKQYGTDYLRDALVKSAKDFIGVPYLWGGTSRDNGFDCSGLTMTVYQLNGLDLPRNSACQFEAGTTVRKNDLQKGDLVFFSVKGEDTVSHVGIFIGDGKFIHASSHGGKIRIDSLSADYFSNQFVDAKTFF
jgi:hypothetical protein